MPPRVADPHGCPTDELRRSLDRAVMLARSGRLLAAGGGWLAAAAVAIAALAAVELLSGRRLGIASLPAGPKIAVILAGAAIPVVAAVRRRLVREGWPDRLGIALATEARRPSLRETLSRAVEFLDAAVPEQWPPRGDRHADARRVSQQAATTEALRRLATDQAAAAARDAGGPIVPGFATDVTWALTGVAMALALWGSTTIAAGGWADAVRRQLAAPSGPAHAPATVAGTTNSTTAPTGALLPSTAVAAAEQLAAAATIERTLADILADHFARAPGVAADSLSREQRRVLDELAAVQAACLHTIDAGRRVINAAEIPTDDSAAAVGPAARDRLRAARERFDGLDRVAAEASVGAILANRLHTAAAAAVTLGDALTAIAGELGVAVGDQAALRSTAGVLQRDDVPGPLAAAAAALARITGGDGRSATGSRSSPANSAGTPAASGQAAAPRRGDGAAGSETAATTDPEGGPVATAARTTSQADAAAIDRVWSLVSPTARWQAGHAALESAPPAYRTAIDTYYRLLLQSLPVRPTTAPP